MKTAFILTAIVVVTILGDYMIKLASQRPYGLVTPMFLGGAFLYGLSAVGWFYLMRSHSLAAIGVFYSAATIAILVGLGFFVFKEPLGLRELLGASLAIVAVLIVSH